MRIGRLLLLALLLPILAFFAANGAQAACGDAAGPFVDWSFCDKSGITLPPGTNLFGANLSGTDLGGATLVGVDMRLATLSDSATADPSLISSADFSNADLTNANLSQAASIDGVNFAGAEIQGLNLGGTVINNAEFSGANGVPQLAGTDINSSTCPNGNASFPSSPYCLWAEPTLLSLIGIGAASLSSLWPAALFSILFAATIGMLLIKRSRSLQEVIR